ncbi:retrovirus-related pol polyprotein from transposon TNT 1-94, partial [Tanacetum coccineum]
KKKKRHASSKTPPGSPPYQPPPPPPPASSSGTPGASGASGLSQLPPSPPPSSTNQSDQSTSTAAPSSSKTAASAEYTAWTTTDTRLKLSVSSIPEELHMDDDTTPNEHVQSSGDEDIGNDYDLARKDLVRGLPRLKFEKDHLCSACQLGKSKKHTHKPKTENTNLEVLNTLHMDLCGPMRVQTINGKKYILVIVDDYSRFTWVKFLRSKDETPEVVIKFLKQIQVGLNKTVRNIRTDNGTEFVNKDLTDYYERVSIFHQKTVPRTPQQNDVVERRNRTLVEAARTMLIFSKALMFLWAEAVATACYTQNRSLIHTRHCKTPYELVHDKKPDLTFFRVFGALCYPTNDSEDLGKLQPTADIGIFIGYAPSRKGLVPSCFAIFTFEPLSLSLSSMPSCDLVSLTNILILCLILKASNQS